MKNVSSEFRKELNNGNRNYIKSAKITLKDSTELNLTDKDFWNNGVKNEDSTSNDNSFDIGSVIIGQLTLTINNMYDDYSDYDFTDAKISNINVGIKLPDKTIESLQYGQYTVNETKYNGSIITLSAYDNMYKFDQPYTKSTLSYPATLLQIAQDACSKCDVSLGTFDFPHNDFVVRNRPTDDGITFRNILQWIAQIACCYCKIDAQGRLTFGWYNTDILENVLLLNGGNFQNWESSKDNVSGGNFAPWTAGEKLTGGDFSSTDGYHTIHSFNSLTLATDDVVLTGVRVSEEVETEEGTETKTYQSGLDGYVISIEGNKLIQGTGATVVGFLAEKLIGLRFRPFNASALSDPTIEAGDIAILTDRKGNTYKTIITSNTFQPGNFQSISCGAETPARNSATRYSQATQIYVDYRKEIQKERTEREKALEELGERLEASTGVFTTIEEQPDGSNIYYLHNKPSLDDSDIVWKMTAEAWGVSTDGGKTWNAGMTVDGDTIVRILTATGVNADWIKTGALQISDTDGNIIFLADMDTKQLIISGDYISIGDQSATDLINQANKNANEALEEVKKAKGFNVILSNEYAGISVDNDGNYTEFPETKTIAYAFMGSQDITDDCSFSVQKSAGVTGSWNADTHTYTVTGLSTDSGWVDITATYMTILTAVKRFNLSKIKGGEPGTPGDPGTPGRTYYIQPSRTALKQTASHNISPGYIDFNAYYRDGTNASRVAYSGRFKIEEQSSAGTWTTIYTSAANETSVRHILYYVLQDTDGNFIGDADGYAFGGWRDIAQIRVSLYAAGGTTQLIDQQTIPVVKDGENGEDGTALTPDEVFNILTNNGEIQGLYKIGDKIYFNAEYIKSGTIVADLIKGGILNLGGVSNENGVLVMRNASGQEIGRWDKDGLVVNSGAISANAISGGALDLGGASNGNGILRIFNASGTQVGYINNTGVHFSQGEVSANVIKGGYLDLGGGSNGDGVLRIFDASGSQIGYINNTGVHFNKGTFSGSLSAATGTFKGELQAATGTFKGELQAATGTFTGSLSASCIKGGTLTLGGVSSSQTIITILDSKSRIAGGIDESGIEFNDASDNSGVKLTDTGLSFTKNGSVQTRIRTGSLTSDDGMSFYVTRGSMDFFYNTSSSDIDPLYTSAYSLSCFGDDVFDEIMYFYIRPFFAEGIKTDYISFEETDVRISGVGNTGRLRISGGWTEIDHVIADTLSVSGSKNRIVTTKNYGKCLQYCYEMPSPMFGDIGEATTDENGECYLFLDDIFQETVTTSIEYQVFLQKEGQGDIWIEEKTEQYFVVKGTPNLKFAWEIKAKQKDYEYERLESFGTEPEVHEPDYEEEALQDYIKITESYESSTFDAINYYTELEGVA